MKGAIVHVERKFPYVSYTFVVSTTLIFLGPCQDLERPQNLSRDFIESYRVPSIYDFARVRLHTGYESPNTYFVGRALKDSGTFEFDYVKVNFSSSGFLRFMDSLFFCRSSTLPLLQRRPLSSLAPLSARLLWMA